MTNYSYTTPNFSIEALLTKGTNCGRKNLPGNEECKNLTINGSDGLRRQYNKTDSESKNLPINGTDSFRRQHCTTDSGGINLSLNETDGLPRQPSPSPLYLPVVPTTMSPHQGKGKATLKPTCHNGK